MFQSYHNIIKRMSGVGRGSESSLQLQREEQQREMDEQQQQQDSVSTEYLVHHWLEATFAWFQVIVLWHEPYISVCAISGLLSSFLLLTYFAPRFYAALMLAIFVYNLNKFWFRHVWPAIRVPPHGDRELEQRLDVDRWTYLHPQLMTLREFQYHISNLIRFSECHLKRQLQTRHQSPAFFCSRLCFIFTCTAFLGKSISGLTLMFSILVIVMSAPGIYAHLLPEHSKLWLQQHYQRLLASGRRCRDEDDDQEPNEGGPANELDITNESEPQRHHQSHMPASLAHKSKETLATSMATTMKSIESLFGNLKKRSLSTSRPVVDQTDVAPANESSDSLNFDQGAEQGVLANLRQDGAKVLFNLIDVTLMGTPTTKQDAKSHQNPDDQENNDSRQLSSSGEQHLSSSANTESTSLSDNNERQEATASETDQQDDGFVML